MTLKKKMKIISEKKGKGVYLYGIEGSSKIFSLKIIEGYILGIYKYGRI